MEKFTEAISQSHTKPFDITGRPMAGWVKVGVKGYESEKDLENWVWQGVNFALTLPAK